MPFPSFEQSSAVIPDFLAVPCNFVLQRSGRELGVNNIYSLSKRVRLAQERWDLLPGMAGSTKAMATVLWASPGIFMCALCVHVQCLLRQEEGVGFLPELRSQAVVSSHGGPGSQT